MKALALVTDAFGGYGGIAQYNRDFLTAVAAIRGVTRLKIIPRLGGDFIEGLPANVIQTAPIKDKYFYSAFAAWAVRRLRPDLIIAGHLYHAPLAAVLARAVGARLVSQLHGTEVWAPLSRQHRQALDASDLILTVSRDTLGRLRDQVVRAKRTGVTLANTVQADFCPGDRLAARARFGLDPGVQVLLTVGRLDERDGYKGHDRVIRLLKCLRAAGRAIVYLIAGVGDDRQRLEGVARDEGVLDLVRFLGKVPYGDLPDLYRAADLFILPSTGEGFGIVYLEAMACGTPALGLRVGGAPDALGDGELGWCVEPDDLVRTVVHALDGPRPDPHQLHAVVQARFGVDVFQGRVADLIGTLQ